MVTISVVVIMTPSVFAVWCIVMFTISVVVTMAPSVFAVAPFMLIVVVVLASCSLLKRSSGSSLNLIPLIDM